MAAQIVQVVIAGNSIEFSRGLLNGQVTFLCSLVYCKIYFWSIIAVLVLYY